MNLDDIVYVPLTGGKNNSGRQRVLGYTVWRRHDNHFLDTKTGKWGNSAVTNNLKELGRDDKGAAAGKMKALRGVYIPETPIVLGEEPLNGHYTLLIHDREQDQMVLAEYPLQYTNIVAEPTPLNIPTMMLAVGIISVLFIAGMRR